MARQRHTAEQIMGKLREVEVAGWWSQGWRAVPLDRGHGANLLSMAPGVRRAEAGSEVVEAA